MVTDRASTACLCIVLGALYPQYIAGLCSLIMLDLFSHWYHTSAPRTGSHKKSSNWLVNAYYNRKVLFTVCASTELWYMSLYMMHFTPGPTLPFPASWGLAPIGLWRAACYASTPLFGFKQLTNVVQLYMACEALVRSVAQQVGTRPLARPPPPPEAACPHGACRGRRRAARRVAPPLHGEALARPLRSGPVRHAPLTTLQVEEDEKKRKQR
jgi:phosphatidylglycerophosphate synthase